jgi:S1-C subfamily serine protease
MSALLSAAVAVSVPVVDGAQSIGDVFRKVNPAVVVIRAKGQDVEGPGGLTRFTETGSGVLVTADGKVMPAAHVVHAMDEIAVEFLGGDTVPARVVSSEPDADLSLLKLERVPQGVGPAWARGASGSIRSASTPCWAAIWVLRALSAVSRALISSAGSEPSASASTRRSTYAEPPGGPVLPATAVWRAAGDVAGETARGGSPIDER